MPAGHEYPRAKIEEDARILWTRTQLNWGYISLQKGKTDYLTFANQGPSTLRIVSVESTCQNLRTTYSLEPIHKGERGKIKVQWIPTEEGQVYCYLTIKSTAKQLVKVILIKGVGYRD